MKTLGWKSLRRRKDRQDPSDKRRDPKVLERCRPTQKTGEVLVHANEYRPSIGRTSWRAPSTFRIEPLDAVQGVRNHLCMPIDPRTIGTDRPRTMDGREYPEHLKAYETFDDKLLPVLAKLGEVTPTELAASVNDQRLRLVVPRWMASAEWRSLIKRTDRDMHSPRTYRLTEDGIARLQG